MIFIAKFKFKPTYHRTVERVIAVDKLYEHEVRAFIKENYGSEARDVSILGGYKFIGQQVVMDREVN